MDYAFTLWTLITGLQFQQTESARYFEKSVRPIIEAKCAGCHSSMGGQDWTQYSQAKRAASKINFRVFVLKDMPPPSGAPLTGSEAATIKKWLQSEKQTSQAGTK